MTIRCIAMDDEPLALSQLKKYIEKVPFLELVEACPDTFSAMKAMESGDIDAIFADINMPDLNGLEFIRSLSDPPIVVFTTAYSEYAIEGYKVNAADYLLKPYGFDDFVAAATKVKRQYELLHQAPAQTLSEPQHDFMYIKTDHSMSRIETSNIMYIEGMGEYVRVHAKDSRLPITTLLSMRKAEQALQGGTFLRVHKSYIANMSLAVSVTRTSIKFGPDDFVPIGDAYKAVVTDFVERHALN